MGLVYNLQPFNQLFLLLLATLLLLYYLLLLTTLLLLYYLLLLTTFDNSLESRITNEYVNTFFVD